MQPVLAETLLLLLLQIGLAVAAREPWTPTFTIPKDPNCLSDGYTTYICVKEPPPCPGLRQHFDLRKEEYKGERKFLIYGHNGLRNRLAQKLNVCDMLHITWDNKLAELANRHHRHCERATYETEKHMINIPGSEEELLRRTYQGGAGVFGRNAFFCPNIYVNNFIEFAVGKWYSLHQKLKPPIPVILREKMYLKIAGDNAFTHMIYPQTFRAGCSYAHFTDGISLICYYYPYVRYNRSIYLRKRPKDYQCPHNFPVSDPIFPHICRYARYKVQN